MSRVQSFGAIITRYNDAAERSDLRQLIQSLHSNDQLANCFLPSSALLLGFIVYLDRTLERLRPHGVPYRYSSDVPLN